MVCWSVDVAQLCAYLIHLYPDECRLEIPSRGIDAKLHVTTSNHILVNIADFTVTEVHD